MLEKLATTSEAETAIQNAISTLTDVVYAGYDTVVGSIKDAWDTVKDFFGIIDVVSDIPELLAENVWAPLGLSITIVVFVAFVKLVVGMVKL